MMNILSINRKLISLKIPEGWAITHNSFIDEDAVVKDGRIINIEAYNEDLLSIEQIWFNGAVWESKTDRYILDLGWYPDSNISGSYRLSLIKKNWDNVVVQFESHSRYEIKKIIELLFDLILQGFSDSEIQKVVES